MAEPNKLPDAGETVAEDILEAFNAEGVIDDPGRPDNDTPADPDDDASDAGAPAP